MSKTSITIQGVQFDIELPYQEGHVLTQAEANALNQTLAENLRNNFASKVRTLSDAIEKERGEGAEFTEEDITGLQAQFGDYATDYRFQGRRAPAAPLDPVDREFTKMVRSLIVEALRKDGKTIKDLKEGQLELYIERVKEARTDLREEAERRINVMKDHASKTLSLESLGVPAEAPAEVAA